MKTDGYFLECGKCGAYDIKKSDPIADSRTQKIKQILTCLKCGREVVGGKANELI